MKSQNERTAKPSNFRDTDHSQLGCGHWGCQVRLERALRGWSQNELANKAGILPATIRRIERGIGTPTEATVAAVRSVFWGEGPNA